MDSGRPVILVSNDDGHQAAGIRALAASMEPLGEVWVVAPEAEQSASSHAISIHRPLRIREVRPRWFAVDGTPTDCSYVGINHVLKDRRPTLMVSGINHGANLADDVTYSGTVAAAMEASLLGIPAIARPRVAGCAQHDFTPSEAHFSSTSSPIRSPNLANRSSTLPTRLSTLSTCGSRRARSAPRPPTCHGSRDPKRRVTSMGDRY